MKGIDPMNLVARARQALGTHEPLSAEIIPFGFKPGELKAVLDGTRVDYSDVSLTIVNAVKENTAMTEPVKTFTDAVIETLKSGIASFNADRDAIVNEQTNEKAAFDAEIGRLNDEIKSRTATHDEAVADFTTRLADADKAIHAMQTGLDDLVTPAAASPIPVPAAGAGGGPGK